MGKKGERIRCWDSCQFKNFARMAGGMNPRREKAERLKHRISHKFSYTFSRFGKIFCTGCGRCIRHCPVNIDILEVLSGVRNQGTGNRAGGERVG